MKEIKKLIETEFQVDLSKISRARRLVILRACYFYLCRKYTHENFRKIGESVEKDPSTVYTAIKKLPDHLKYEPGIKSKLIQIEGKIPYIANQKLKM